MPIMQQEALELDGDTILGVDALAGSVVYWVVLGSPPSTTFKWT